MPANNSLPNFRIEENLKVLETFAGAVIWLNEEGKIIYVSDTWFDLFDLKKGTIENKNWTEIDKEVSTHTFDKIWDKLCTDDFLDWHTTLQFNPIQKHPVLVEGRIAQNDLCLTACLRVSFIHKTNPQLKLRHILSLPAISATWKWDLITGEFTITDSFFPIFSLPLEEIDVQQTNIVKLLQPFLSNQQLKELENRFQKLIQSRTKVEFIWTPTIGNVPKKILLKAFPVVENKKAVAIHGSIRQPNKILKKERLNAIANAVLELSGNTVLILDEYFYLVYANKSAFQNLGIQEIDLKNDLSIFKIDIEQTTGQWNNHLKVLRMEKNLGVVTSFQRKDATIFPVELTIIHYQDFYGELICIIAKDISEDRKKESILKATLADQASIAHQLEEKADYLQREDSKNFKFEDIVSVSKRYQPVLAKIRQVAPTSSTVLIEGETGTGKELVARAIHQLSPRAHRTMIKINCANLPKELIESELFGHEKGSFTGAFQQKKGRFELADKGTLFLDEIGELPLELQSRLLRVLQEGEFERVGGNKTIRVDIRIIVATNRDLKEMVADKKFREDLYYRLHVFPIYNIPLRERKEDIEHLAYHFLRRFSKKMNRKILTIDKKDMDRLHQYNFPGNIRELENIIERSVILTTGESLNLDYWQPLASKSSPPEKEFVTFEEMQKKYIIKALEKTKWKISGKNGAAELLGMNDQTLFSKMRKFGISRS